VAFVVALVRSLAMIDGTVTRIFFGFFGMKFSVMVMMNDVMETLEGDNIQEITEQQ
jgi:hypothetical protein